MNPFRAVTEGNADALEAALDKDPSLAGDANPDGVSLVRWALYHGRRDLADVDPRPRPPARRVRRRRRRPGRTAEQGRAPRPIAGLGPVERRVHAAAPRRLPRHRRVRRHPAVGRGRPGRGGLRSDDRAAAAQRGRGGQRRHRPAAARRRRTGRRHAVRRLHPAARGRPQRRRARSSTCCSTAAPTSTIATDAGQTAADLAADAGHADLATRLRPRT